MATAPMALVAAVLSPSHGPRGFTSKAVVPPSNPRAAAVPHRRGRRSSSARCAISTVNSNGRLAEADRATAAVATVGLQDLQATPLLRRERHDEETITMIARVTVHTDSILQDPGKWSFGSIADILFRPNWLRLELVSSELDPKTGEEWEISSYAHNHGRHDDTEFTMVLEASFAVPVSFGPVGAVRVVNEHTREMEIGGITVFREGEESGSDAVTFHCNSWVHPVDKRTFFPLNSYLPSQTPEGVARLRKEELQAIRGDGQGERKSYERVYDYDVYNDLGDPDRDLDTKRPVLGGKDRPYPRRCRTGRGFTKNDPLSEKRSKEAFYVPRDEAFTERKNLTFKAKFALEALNALGQKIRTKDHKSLSFPSLAAIDAMYKDGFRNHPEKDDLDWWSSLIHELEEELGHFLQFEMPEIHDKDKFAWFRDEEFARETLAGMNPLSIQLVTEFPIFSKLDEATYGPADSLITKELIEEQINRVMTAEEAVKNKKLFMLDYHDMLLPYVHAVRELDNTTLYASRTLFFLTADGTLRPIAIELTRPKSKNKPQWRQVFTPGSDGSVTGSWLWQLAKAHVLAHDTGYHQLVSHWLRTHCCVEPYIIAANRQLSQMHPIFRLLHPHFRFTMEINAMARNLLISADGIIEGSFAPGKHCMDLSSAVYDKFWRFDMEALPADLIRRGMAVEGKDGKLELTIEDYPYANDGLLIWDAIKEWVSDYVAHYYPSASDITGDEELQGWWTEVRTKGHADKQGELWWPMLDSRDSLVQVLSTIIWVASAHHAAVNFGQYPYAGYLPNRPTTARQIMPPEEGRKGMRRLALEPEKVLLDTFPSQFQSTLALPVLDVLSTHSPGEEYIGTHADPAWLAEGKIRSAFEKFRGRMMEIVAEIDDWNEDPERKNRHGAGVVPYVLLKPCYGDPANKTTVMEMGIPNSISI
ncbi:unnamed protein product [Urochloa decumbens]|uniref:Lipoxygenase n=1 Tax=Urochloa decumbens TaxID=240449 RepID=A0ABC9DM63_9POAL